MKPPGDPSPESRPSALLRAILVLGGVAVLLVGAYRWSVADNAPAPALADFGPLPHFELTRETGAAVADADLTGRVWIADFIFTRCAGPCPRMSAQMAAVQTSLADQPRIALVTFTVDPEFDTPEVLSDYSRESGADPARWMFLTGHRHDIYPLALHGFKLAIDADPNDERAIIHSTKFVLVDAARHIRGYYDGTDPADVARLTRDAAGLAQAAAR